MQRSRLQIGAIPRLFEKRTVLRDRSPSSIKYNQQQNVLIDHTYASQMSVDNSDKVCLSNSKWNVNIHHCK